MKKVYNDIKESKYLRDSTFQKTEFWSNKVSVQQLGIWQTGEN